MTNVLTPEEEKVLARFVCRLALNDAIDAYKQGLPEGIKSENAEKMATSAMVAAAPAIDKLAEAYVYTEK